MPLIDQYAPIPRETPHRRQPRNVQHYSASWHILPASVLFALTSVACGGVLAPNQQLTSAESAVRAAEVGGAEELPKGELHLKFAKDAIAEARTLMDKGENEQATLLLDKAAVDAEQALALAEEEESRALAEEQLERIEELTKK